MTQEVEVSQKDWRQVGKWDGLRWASGAEKSELECWGAIAQDLSQADVLWDTFSFPEELTEEIQDLINGVYANGFDYAQYAEGWITGVRAYWLGVEDSIG